jgi:hypothetical protein
MLDAAREALSFLEGRTLDDLKRDRMLALSLVKELEIIGEAASKVSDEVRGLAPDIPWPMIVGMRRHRVDDRYLQAAKAHHKPGAPPDPLGMSCSDSAQPPSPPVVGTCPAVSARRTLMVTSTVFRPRGRLARFDLGRGGRQGGGWGRVGGIVSRNGTRLLRKSFHGGHGSSVRFWD